MTDEAAVRERLTLEQTKKSGANWFLWIAALSVINTVLVLTGTNFNFVFGLGITQLIDGLFSSSPVVVRAIAVVVDLSIAGAFVGIGLLARTREWAFITGMVIYAGDAVIFLLVREWVGLGFHVFALFLIYAGFKAAMKLSEAPPVPVAPPTLSAPAP